MKHVVTGPQKAILAIAAKAEGGMVHFSGSDRRGIRVEGTTLAGVPIIVGYQNPEIALVKHGYLRKTSAKNTYKITDLGREILGRKRGYNGRPPKVAVSVAST